MFAGPSAEMAVEGLIAATRTTGLSVVRTCSRKNAVSSMVSVPWVMTMPSASPFLKACSIRLARSIQTLSFMSWLPMLETWSVDRSASFSMPGTAAMRSSPETWPAS
jgi:hypothetical protein